MIILERSGFRCGCLRISAIFHAGFLHLFSLMVQVILVCDASFASFAVKWNLHRESTEHRRRVVMRVMDEDLIHTAQAASLGSAWML